MSEMPQYQTLENPWCTPVVPNLSGLWIPTTKLCLNCEPLSHGLRAAQLQIARGILPSQKVLFEFLFEA